MYKNINNYENIEKYNKIIILMRHSQATHNKFVDIAVKNAIENNKCPIKAKEAELMKKIHLNPTLSYEGKNNAKKQTSIIKNFVNIDETIILCSPLLRSLQTANYFSFNNKPKKIIPLDSLLERRTKRPCDNFTIDSIDYTTEEENNEGVFKRTQYFCSYITNFKSKFIIVITHKRFLIELEKNKKYFKNYGNSYFEPGEFRVFVN